MIFKINFILNIILIDLNFKKKLIVVLEGGGEDKQQ